MDRVHVFNYTTYPVVKTPKFPPPPQNSLQNVQNFYCSVISKIRPVLWLWFSVLNHLLAVCWWCRWFSEVFLSVKPKPKEALMMSVSQHDNKEATTGNLKTPFQYIYVPCWSWNIFQMSNIDFICLHSKWALLCFTFTMKHQSVKSNHIFNLWSWDATPELMRSL